jgi:hypothetical protein
MPNERIKKVIYEKGKLKGGANMIALLALLQIKYEEYKAKNNGKNPYIVQAEEIIKLINDIKYNR